MAADWRMIQEDIDGDWTRRTWGLEVPRGVIVRQEVFFNPAMGPENTQLATSANLVF